MSYSTDRSYLVRDDVPAGSRVALLADAVNGRFREGDEATVIGYSNAGEAGIMASLRMDDGRTLHNVSAGILGAVEVAR